jgi:hypothetical protein
VLSQIANPRANMLVVDDAVQSHADSKNGTDRPPVSASSASPQSGK